jgi:hypothetical protein
VQKPLTAEIAKKYQRAQRKPTSAIMSRRLLLLAFVLLCDLLYFSAISAVKGF